MKRRTVITFIAITSLITLIGVIISKNLKKLFLGFLLIIMSITLFSQTRVGDISKIAGADTKQLIGYGLVVGLQGTGDSPASAATIQSLNNMLENFGLSVPETRIRPNNVAAVIVTASMPAFAAQGTMMDVTVSSMSDARSLEGGILMMTPLMDNQKRLYAFAQGPISMGGYKEESKQIRVRSYYSNAGRIPNGAIIENNNPNIVVTNGELKINLFSADFSTAQLVANAINNQQGMRLATPENSSTVSVIVPDAVMTGNNLVAFIAALENLNVNPQTNARVVINERTGTVVAGGNVQIMQVAIAHGNLILRIGGETVEYTTGPFTLVVPETSNENINDGAQRMFVMSTATVQELAQALNAIKMTPRDMIAIFQSLKEAGALLAELKIL